MMTLNIKTPERFLHTVLLSLLLLLSHGAIAQNTAAANKLSASVDRTQISIEETLTLNVRFNEQSLFSEPDFSQLEQDFDILSRNQSSKYQFTNGRSESYVTWQLTLAPKREGKLLIPSFEYDGHYSDAIAVNVTAPQVASNQPDQPVYLEATLDKDEIFVQEQALLTLKLFTSVNLAELSGEELKLDNALVKQVAEHQYQKVISGKRYAVVEVSYAIFPQASGELSIPPLLWNVAVQSQRNRSYDPFGNQFGSPFGNLRNQAGQQRLRLRTPERKITVLPQPAITQGETWLPAKDIKLEQQWSNSPDSFVAGEPITRTITMTAEGLTASQLPPLTIDELPGVKYYPDQPKTNDINSSDGVIGKREESLAIVPNRTGTITLPAITVSWWDTEEKRLKEATLPVQTITVKPQEGQLANMASSDGMAASAAESVISTNSPANTSAMSTLWPWLTFLNFIIAVVFAVLWWRGGRKTNNTTTVKTVSSTPSDNSYKALCQALNSQQPNIRDIRQCLLDWGQSRFKADSMKALATAAEDNQFSLLLQHLEASLYSTADQPLSQVELTQLLDRVKQLEKGKSKETHKNQSELQSLYPQAK